jgi:hypothetical protein
MKTKTCGSHPIRLYLPQVLENSALSRRKEKDELFLSLRYAETGVSVWGGNSH